MSLADNYRVILASLKQKIQKIQSCNWLLNHDSENTCNWLLNNDSENACTVKFLNFRTPENFAVIYLKFKQRGQTLGYFVKKMQME